MAPSVLVVCLGNICRSPMGEAVLKHVAKQRGIDMEVDSAGTAAYHTGEDPDERAVETLVKHKVPVHHHARKVSTSDFTRFTHILAADEQNLRNLERLKPRGATAEVRLWGSYDDGRQIDDPYYGGMHGFEKAYQQCVRYSNAFLDDVCGKESVVPTGTSNSSM